MALHFQQISFLSFLFMSSDLHSPGLKDAGQLSESSYAKAPMATVSPFMVYAGSANTS